MDAFNQDEFYMRMALQEAQRAADAGEVPCGAVIVLDDQIIGKAHNQTEAKRPHCACGNACHNPSDSSGWQLAIKRCNAVCHQGALYNVRRRSCVIAHQTSGMGLK